MTCVECINKQLYINQLKLYIEDFYKIYIGWNTSGTRKKSLMKLIELAKIEVTT